MKNTKSGPNPLLRGKAKKCFEDAVLEIHGHGDLSVGISAQHMKIQLSWNIHDMDKAERKSIKDEMCRFFTEFMDDTVQYASFQDECPFGHMEGECGPGEKEYW